MIKTREDHPFLPIAEGNHLVSTKLNRKDKKGVDMDDDYYDEVSDDGTVVAKYYTWHHVSHHPPQKVRQGWEKFDLTEKRIASGSEHF